MLSYAIAASLLSRYRAPSRFARYSRSARLPGAGVKKASPFIRLAAERRFKYSGAAYFPFVEKAVTRLDRCAIFVSFHYIWH